MKTLWLWCLCPHCQGYFNSSSTLLPSLVASSSLAALCSLKALFLVEMDAVLVVHGKLPHDNERQTLQLVHCFFIRSTVVKERVVGLSESLMWGFSTTPLLPAVILNKSLNVSELQFLYHPQFTGMVTSLSSVLICSTMSIMIPPLVAT